jgi:prepilin-type N-terminal cleavage/methylation domain-containing protein
VSACDIPSIEISKGLGIAQRQWGRGKKVVGFFSFHCRKEQRMKRSGNSKGFTYTELLIVLLIIAILVAIAIPNYMKFVNKIREMAGW